MAIQSLVTFIRTSIEQGHDAYSIRNHLVRSGYRTEDINEAFNVVYNKHDTKFPKKWILISFILLLFIIAVFAAVVFLLPDDESSAAPIRIAPSASGDCFDGIQNNDEEGVDCGGSCSACADEDAVAPIEDGDQVEFEDQEPVEEEIDSDPDVFVPGQERPSWEILNEIHEIALVDPDKAANECSEIDKQETRDSCYLDLAQVTRNDGNCKFIQKDSTKDGCYAHVANKAKDSSICQKITYVELRDSCYMDFIIDGDYELCSDVQTDYYQSACDILTS